MLVASSRIPSRVENGLINTPPRSAQVQTHPNHVSILMLPRALLFLISIFRRLHDSDVVVKPPSTSPDPCQVVRDWTERGQGNELGGDSYPSPTLFEELEKSMTCGERTGYDPPQTVSLKRQSSQTAG